MAFTDEQRAKIRRYLGWSDVHLQRDWAWALESAMDVVGGRPEVQSLVEQELTALDAIWSSFTSSSGVLAKAGLKRVDDIEFYQGAQIRDYRSIGASLCDALAAHFGVRKYRDIFGGGACGGLIPLG